MINIIYYSNIISILYFYTVKHSKLFSSWKLELKNNENKNRFDRLIVHVKKIFSPSFLFPSFLLYNICSAQASFLKTSYVFVLSNKYHILRDFKTLKNPQRYFLVIKVKSYISILYISEFLRFFLSLSKWKKNQKRKTHYLWQDSYNNFSNLFFLFFFLILAQVSYHVKVRE